MSLPGMVLVCGAYILIGRWLVRAEGFRWRHAMFATLNVALMAGLVGWAKGSSFAVLLILANLGLLVAQYLGLRLWGQRSGLLPWLAFLIPIAALIVVRYVPLSAFALFSSKLHAHLLRHPEVDLASRFIGLSYLAFRTSHLVLLVRNKVVPMPSFGEYVGFALFVPTLLVGPISPFSEHHRGFSERDRPLIPVGRALLRVLVGFIKYKFFGPLLSQLTYVELLQDGHPHGWIDLVVAAFAFYLFLYCNFSGFCDMAIGAAGLMGIPVAENFDSPFVARNMKEFWNRWHITLSLYMRDVVFSPLSKFLVRVLGPSRTNHAVAITIFVVFLLVGIWHGVGWNWVAFGLACGLGVVGNHYYSIALKKWLGKERYSAYVKNRAIHAVAVVATFVYVAFSLFLFANDVSTMKRIFHLVNRG